MFWATVVFGAIIGALVGAFWPTDTTHVTVMYNCSIAEISPDYPVAVKEACRKRNKK